MMFLVEKLNWPKNPKLIVTSYSHFIDDVFKSSKEKTIIFISHKLDALKNCNKIYDLNKMSFIEKKNDN